MRPKHFFRRYGVFPPPGVPKARKAGAASTIRTLDLLITSELLYP